MSRIVVPGGESHVPPHVASRLKEIDPRLFVRPTMVGYQNGSEQADIVSTRWAWQVCLRWQQGDPRWARVQRGERTEEQACDLIATIPPNVSLDDMPGYLARNLYRGVAPVQVAEKIAQWNQDQQIRNGEGVTEFAAELFKVNRKSIAENPYDPAKAKRAEKRGTKAE